LGPGLVLTEVVNVIFGGPGDVDAEEESPVTIGAAEIDEGQSTFDFLFTGTRDGFRWHGQVQVTVAGQVNSINLATDNPLEHEDDGRWVASLNNGLQLGCGWAPQGG
jgi:hypothetical protein